jgi:CRP-like cAMP-binding protein
MGENHILTKLLRRQPELNRNLSLKSFSARDVIAQPEQPLDHLIFPITGMVAMTVAVGSDLVEVGMIGPEGVIGGGAVFGARRHLTFASGCVSGTAHLLPAAVLIDLAKRDEIVRKSLFRAESWLLVQAQQIAACNGRHTVPQRLCHWLLRAADINGNKDLPATQELIAELLGIQRASISSSAAKLQDKGCIQYSRGVISIIDRKELEAGACECYAILQQRRLDV